MSKLMDSRELRKQLTLQERWELCCQMLEEGASAGEVRRIVNELPDKKRVQFWKILRSAELHNSPMYEVAPPVFQKAAARHVFSKQFISKRINQLVLPNHFSAVNILSGLDRADWALAERWIGNDVSKDYRPSVRAQMLSARAAEKAVMKFYRLQGHHVRDVAIEQQTGVGKDYLTHDLLLDRDVPIDVKNTRSRRWYNANKTSTTFVEHIVPRFKRSRNMRPVKIVGVFSTYLNLEAFRKPNDFAHGEFTVLGETDFDVIKKLSRRFGSDTLGLNILDSVRTPSRSSSWEYVLPVWLFNYPERFYRQLDDQLQLNQLHGLSDRQVLAHRTIHKIRECLPLATMLAVGRDLPQEWRSKLPIWQQQFFKNLLLCRAERSLPVLFLTVLQHFTQMLSGAPVGYHPAMYRHMLLLPRPRISMDTVKPDISGGLYDPMRVIRSLCSNLETVWWKQRQMQTWRFDRYSYRGLGILRGWSNLDKKWVSIMAFCGGDIPGRGRCGAELLLGTPGIRVCKRCGYLICPKCGYCSQQCHNSVEQNRFM